MSTSAGKPRSSAGAVTAVLKNLYAGAVGDLDRLKSGPAGFEPRPSNWAGYWSKQYGRVLAHTLDVKPPLVLTAREALAKIPKPLQETFDPLPSTAELTDRHGQPLAWRWNRSTTHDLLGPIGITFGGACFLIVLSSILFSRLDLPPLMRSKIEPSASDPIGAAAPSKTSPTDDAQRPQGAVPDRVKDPTGKVVQDPLNGARARPDGGATQSGPRASPDSRPPDSPRGKPRS